MYFVHVILIPYTDIPCSTSFGNRLKYNDESKIFFLDDHPLSPIEMPCTETLDVYNSMNIYEKSICLVTQPKNYTNARQNCMKNGMQLYRIVSTDTKLALLNFVNKKCAMEGVSSIFIKGRRGSDCSVLNKAEDVFFENYGKCAEQSWSICEYINLNGKLIIDLNF